MSAASEMRMPSPDLYMQAVRAFQVTAAIKSAIDLNIFSAIGEGGSTAAEIAKNCGTDERGARILCDFLVISGFLTKSADKYAMTIDTAAFLNPNSPMCLASTATFLADPKMMGAYDTLAESVRKGGSAMPEGGTIVPDNPIWVTFAESMAPLMMMVASAMAQVLAAQASRAKKALDIAAGHGVYGLTLAKQNPQLKVVGLDWAPVLEVAKRNAQKFGVADRYSTIPGSAFDVDFGSGYDIVLVPNFLHHFSPAVNVAFLKKVRAALNDGGHLAIVEMVPNDDRVSPPWAAAFALTMLASTQEGDAFTYRELEKMCRDAGFSNVAIHSLQPSPQSLVTAEK